MIVFIGLIILVAAVVVGLAGVLANSGHAHELTNNFAVFGYHVTGSTGTLLLYGIVVGAVGMCGLGLLLAGHRRTARRGNTARRQLEQSRRDTTAVTLDRDKLTGGSHRDRNTPSWRDRLHWRPTRHPATVAAGASPEKANRVRHGDRRRLADPHPSRSQTEAGARR